MKYEILTHDGKSYEIQQTDPEIISKLSAKLELVPVTLKDGRIEYFSKGTVARIQSSHAPSSSKQITKGDEPDYRGTISTERIAEMRAKIFDKK